MPIDYQAQQHQIQEGFRETVEDVGHGSVKWRKGTLRSLVNRRRRPRLRSNRFSWVTFGLLSCLVDYGLK